MATDHGLTAPKSSMVHDKYIGMAVLFFLFSSSLVSATPILYLSKNMLVPLEDTFISIEDASWWRGYSVTKPIVLAVVFKNIGPDTDDASTVQAQLMEFSRGCTCASLRETLATGPDTASSETFELRIVCKTNASLLQLFRKYVRTLLDSCDYLTRLLPLVFQMAHACECRHVHDMQPFFPAYHGRKSDYYNPNHLINRELAKKIEQPLRLSLKSAGNVGKGYIYVLKSKSIPQHVKIGWTQTLPEARSREWARCYKDVCLLACSSPIGAHASRVEQLIHAELALFRRKDECRACGNEHGEWFQVSPQTAKSTVSRWVKWMASQPYSQSTGRLLSSWSDRLHPVNERHYSREILNFKPGIDGRNTTQPSWQSWSEYRHQTTRDDPSSRAYVRDCHEYASMSDEESF